MKLLLSYRLFLKDKIQQRGSLVEVAAVRFCFFLNVWWCALCRRSIRIAPSACKKILSFQTFTGKNDFFCGKDICFVRFWCDLVYWTYNCAFLWWTDVKQFGFSGHPNKTYATLKKHHILLCLKKKFKNMC